MRWSLIASLTAMCVWTVACGGLSYPDDRGAWTLAETPNAIEGGDVVGHLLLMDDGNGNPFATLTEIASKDATSTEPARQLDIDWRGDWSVDGDTTTVSLDCVATAANNVPSFDCTGARLTLSCRVQATKLDCGDYQFE